MSFLYALYALYGSKKTYMSFLYGLYALYGSKKAYVLYGFITGSSQYLSTAAQNENYQTPLFETLFRTTW